MDDTSGWTAGGYQQNAAYQQQAYPQQMYQQPQAQQQQPSASTRTQGAGNNPYGAQGLLKCEECRRRRKQCIYNHVDLPCEHCLKNPPLHTTCIKQYGPATVASQPNGGNDQQNNGTYTVSQVAAGYERQFPAATPAQILEYVASYFNQMQSTGQQPQVQEAPAAYGAPAPIYSATWNNTNGGTDHSTPTYAELAWPDSSPIRPRVLFSNR